MHLIRTLIVGLLLSTSPLAFAEVDNAPVVNTQAQNSTINSTVLGTAQDWHLSSDEWAHYQQLLQGPSGKYYPQLTPAAVLGLNAQTPEDQRHYAEIVAQEEHDKIAREIQFDTQVHQALLRLYPNEPLIAPFDLSPFNPVQSAKAKTSAPLLSGDHLVLFTDPNSNLDVLMMPLLIRAIQSHPGVVLDIYFSGAGDDNAIRGWAKLRAVPPLLVSSDRITLNQDTGQLNKVAPKNAALPYLVRVRNGQSQPVSPWGLA